MLTNLANAGTNRPLLISTVVYEPLRLLVMLINSMVAKQVSHIEVQMLAMYSCERQEFNQAEDAFERLLSGGQ